MSKHSIFQRRSPWPSASPPPSPSLSTSKSGTSRTSTPLAGSRSGSHTRIGAGSSVPSKSSSVRKGKEEKIGLRTMLREGPKDTEALTKDEGQALDADRSPPPFTALDSPKLKRYLPRRPAATTRPTASETPRKAVTSPIESPMTEDPFDARPRRPSPSSPPTLQQLPAPKLASHKSGLLRALSGLRRSGKGSGSSSSRVDPVSPSLNVAPSPTTAPSEGFQMAATPPLTPSERRKHSSDTVEGSPSSANGRLSRSVAKMKSVFSRSHISPPAEVNVNIAVAIAVEKESDHDSPLSSAGQPAQRLEPEAYAGRDEFPFPLQVEDLESSPFLPSSASSFVVETHPNIRPRRSWHNNFPPARPRHHRARRSGSPAPRPLRPRQLSAGQIPRHQSFLSLSSQASSADLESPFNALNRPRTQHDPRSHPYLHLTQVSNSVDTFSLAPSPGPFDSPHLNHLSPYVHKRIPSPDPQLGSHFSDFSSPEPDRDPSPSDYLSSPDVPPIRIVSAPSPSWAVALPGNDGDCEPLLDRLARRNTLRREVSAPSLLDRPSKSLDATTPPTSSATLERAVPVAVAVGLTPPAAATVNSISSTTRSPEFPFAVDATASPRPPPRIVVHLAQRSNSSGLGSVVTVQ